MDIENIAPNTAQTQVRPRLGPPPRKSPPLTRFPQAGKPKKGGRTVEQIYQKKTQLEHILLRPDTYGACPAVCRLQVRDFAPWESLTTDPRTSQSGLWRKSRSRCGSTTAQPTRS